MTNSSVYSITSAMNNENFIEKTLLKKVSTLNLVTQDARSYAWDMAQKTRDKFESLPEVKSFRQGSLKGVKIENISLYEKIVCSVTTGAFLISSLIAMMILL